MSGQELGKALVDFIQGAATIDRDKLTRAESMASIYGECCSKERAAELLNCSHRTITQYVYDGKLKTCCEGKKIDVRSIAAFLEAPANVIDRRRKGAKKEDWMV